MADEGEPPRGAASRRAQWRRWGLAAAAAAGLMGVAAVVGLHGGLINGRPPPPSTQGQGISAAEQGAADVAVLSLENPKGSVEGSSSQPVSSSDVNPAAPLPEEGAQSSSNSKSNEHLAWLVQEGGGVGGQPSMQKQEQGLGQTACSVRGMEELLAAIEANACATIHLESTSLDDDATPYTFTDEVLIQPGSRVVLQGTAAALPLLDCGPAIRCFRVLDGGYLELRYVRINQSREGLLRPTTPIFEGITPSGLVREFRGSSVYFEPGATGGTFVGVFFDDDQSDPEHVDQIVRNALALHSERIYGGFVYMAGGSLQFTGCFFWDFEVITPLDRIYLGGDILVLAGEISFTGCVWVYTTFFGLENGAGFNVALLGGVATYTMCQFTEVNGILAMNGVGQAFMVAGGVQVLTGVSLSYFTVAGLFTGTGEMTVFAGAQIATGVSLFDSYGMLAAFGAGLDFCVGAGAMVHTGVAINQYSGPFISDMIGGLAFVGAGTMVAIGSPTVSSCTTVQEAGIGGTFFLDVGHATCIGCPVIDFVGIACSTLLGEFVAVNAGFLVWIGGPFVEYSAIEVFYGLGGTVYVGTGAGVFGYSPLVEAIALVNDHKDYWIQGTCEADEGAWAPGPPFFVSGGRGGCELDGNEPNTTARHLEKEKGAAAGKDERIGLVLFNASRQQMDFSDAELRDDLTALHSVPPPMVDAAEAMLSALVQTQRPPSSKQRETSVYVGGPLPGVCRICGVDSVEGPGADACKPIQPSCASGSSDHAAAAAVPASVPLLGHDHEEAETGVGEEMKERFLILGDITSTGSERRLQGQQSQAWEARLKDAAAAAVPGMDGGQEALQLSVWDAAPDPFFSPSSSSEEWGKGEGMGQQVFKFAIITTNPDDARALIAALEQPLDDHDDDQPRLQQHLTEDVSSVSFVRMIHVPAYDPSLIRQQQPPPLQAFGATTTTSDSGTSGSISKLDAKGGPASILLLDPLRPAGDPVSVVDPQDRYLVRLDNFIPRLPVRLLLLLSSNNNSSGTIDDASSSVFQLDLGAITVDVTGSAAVVRRLFEEVMDVPDPLLPKEKGATFRVRAQQEVGEGEGVVTDFSRPFALSRTWRDRRLDGSSEAVVARRNRRHRRRRRR